MLFAVVRIGCLCIYTAYSCWDHLADVKAAGHCTHLFRHFLIGTVPFIFGEGCPCIDATVFFSRLFQVRSTDFWFVYLPLSCGLEVNQFRMQRNAESLAASKMRWRVNGQWGKPKNWWPKCEWTSSRAEAFIFFFKLYVIFFLKCYVDRDGPKGHSLGFWILETPYRVHHPCFSPFICFCFSVTRINSPLGIVTPIQQHSGWKKKGFGLLSLSDFHLEMLKQSRTHQRLSQFERNDAAYDLIMESPCKKDQISDEILLRLFQADLLYRVIYIYTRTLFERGGKKRVSQSDAVDRIIYA